MINKKKWKTLKLIIISLLGIIIIIQPLVFVVYAQVNYSITLEKGTQILEVKRYDEQTWKNTINFNSTPSDWFGGEANKIGAKSKSTLLDYSRNDHNTHTMFKMLIVPQNSLSIFLNVSNYGYNFTYVNSKYPKYYFVWDNNFHYWAFSTKEFKDNPDILYKKSQILQDPQNITTLLNDYNNFAGIINNDTTLQLLGYTLPILSGDDLLFQFIIRKNAVPNPIKDYLTLFTNVLDCKNATILGNTIIFQIHGEKNYSVEVIYNTQGLIDRFAVKNSEGYIFYEITSFYPKIIFYIILGILAIFLLGTVILVSIKKIKLQKHFKEN